MGRKKSLKQNLLIALLAGSAALYTMPIYAATSVIANNALPSGGEVVAGGITIPDWAKPNGIQGNNLVMNIQQSTSNGIIKWDKFDVGGSATVNFNGNLDGYNTLNYVNGGNLSQIYGTINANNNGNIYIVNPAGVQIGNSAQINVGSLYVSNKYLKETDIGNFNGDNIDTLIDTSKSADAALMSLGNINATNVTFEGDGRIVIDSERIKDAYGAEKLNYQYINITTAENNTGNIIIGYDAYDATNGYKDANPDGNGNEIANVNGNAFTKADGYMWVEDVEQLQAIGTNLSGNYALRNSIDATSTEQNGFTSIGSAGNNAFKGKFDGIEYNIFGLNITGNDNAGLFGYTNGATINNVTLVGGSISGGENVGAVVGSANNTTISNVVNSAAVTGGTNVGGIVGSADGTIVENAINTGAITSNGTSDNNGGLVSNIGGLIGIMTGTITNGESDSKLIGNSYNLGNVEGVGHNVGGLVGYAVKSTIGDGTNLVYNRLDVTGSYNVGGIVGNMEGSTVQNAENSATVTATGNTTEDYTYHSAHYANNNNNDVTVNNNVNVANVGGIAGNSSEGSSITDVTNTGDVSSNKEENNDYYDAGNVGGIVGKAVDTNITNATNKENDIRGAHNVGGVAGYFGNTNDAVESDDYTVTNGINDGGDIMATGARDKNGFVKEWVRVGNTGGEETIIGNMGGVVGYLDGNNVYVSSSANRGTVHSLDITGNTVSDASKASNTGGIVGKLDRDSSVELAYLQNSTAEAAVSDSYNTGDVRGYMGVGGIVGMMYNGEVAHSYNNGAINTTRQPGNAAESYYSVNMGGIVGDTTEGTNANAVLYDVYNKGQIGDETYTYYARHVGGIVGRLSGTVDKAYNTGTIYNGYNVVGGIAGWFYKGEISNSFNTGNITVLNKENTIAGSQVGGIAGAVSGYYGESVSIKNAYNLGTLRSFQNTDKGVNYIGGIIGRITGYTPNVTIQNVYTTGNLYAQDINGNSTDNGLGSIYGRISTDPITINGVSIQNAYYISPESDSFEDLSNIKNQHTHFITYENKDNKDYWKEFYFSDNGSDDGEVGDENKGDWRIYEGTTPILNAFLPNAEDYFSEHGLKDSINNSFDSIQYGTAYDPHLTIINTKGDLTFSMENGFSITNAAGLAVYGGGLTLNSFDTSSGTGHFGGTIYADGVLNLNAEGDNNIDFGSASQIYGSAVNITTDGKVTIYGDVTATGHIEDGSININAGDVDVYGTLTSATENDEVKIPGISDKAVDWTPGQIDKPTDAMTDIADRFAHTVTSSKDGNIVIHAGTNDNGDGNGDGNVNLYYGNKENGLITTGGNLTVEATGDVYVDSDLDIDGGLSLTAGADKEIVLDITNIGQVQTNHNQTESVNKLHGFLSKFNSEKNAIKFGGTNDAKITVDMWTDDKFDLDKFDKNDAATLAKALQNVCVNVNDNTQISAPNITYIWVSSADQLNNIQEYKNGKDDSNILNYNFALKNDINASGVTNYNVIGGDDSYNGTFDGRGNRIIGLTVKNNNPDNGNAGIFSTIGDDGVVKNLNIYSGNFAGTTNAGAVAGVNNGRIENITAFGNTVTSDGNAGGIVGVNNNDIDDVESTGSVIAANANAVVGGLVGTNETNATISNSYSNSAVTTKSGVTTTGDLGGVVGVNKGAVSLVDSLGITNGGISNNVGGVIGVNSGTLNSAYNESIVSGHDNVGGIIGVNGQNDTVSNIVNATGTSGHNNVGGLVGSNSGTVSEGRNNGTITGNEYVGGMVGSNADGSTLNNLVNGKSADITGVNYVGGIAGSNAGTITADEDNDNLINRGSITGHTYVGGVAGVNTSSGIIANTNNSVVLNANEDVTGTAEYFGGVVGQNRGLIDGATNTSDINITAVGGAYVGGIIGENTSDGRLEGEILNQGSVAGESNVGGIIGKNLNDNVLQGTVDDRLIVTN